MRPYLLLLIGLEILSIASAQTVPLAQQNEILKAQNAILRDANKDIFAVLYWSLAFVGTFLVGGASLIGILGIRRIDHDKENLKRELNDTIQSSLRDSEGAIDNLSSSLKEEIDTRLIEIQRSLVSMNEEADKRQDKVFDNKLSSMELSIKLVELDHLTLEGRTTDNVAGKIHIYIRATELAASVDYGHRIEDNLERILEIKELSAVVASIPSIETRLTVMLDSLPSRYKALAERIRHQMRSHK